MSDSIRLSLITKTILLILSNIFILRPLEVEGEVLWFFFLFLVFIIEQQGQLKTHIKYMLVYLLLQGVFLMTGHFSNSLVLRILGIVCYIILKFYPCLYVARTMISNLKVDEAYYSFKMLRINQNYIIPFLIFARMLPIANAERKEIVFQLKMRNGKLKLKDLPELLSTLIVNLVLIGDEITKAAMTKGVGYSKNRTHVQTYPLTTYDYGSMVAAGSLFIYLVVSL